MWTLTALPVGDAQLEQATGLVSQLPPSGVRKMTKLYVYVKQ